MTLGELLEAGGSDRQATGRFCKGNSIRSTSKTGSTFRNYSLLVERAGLPCSLESNVLIGPACYRWE